MDFQFKSIKEKEVHSLSEIRFQILMEFQLKSDQKSIQPSYLKWGMPKCSISRVLDHNDLNISST